MFICIYKGYLYINKNIDSEMSLDGFNPVQFCVPETGEMFITENPGGEFILTAYREVSQHPLTSSDVKLSTLFATRKDWLKLNENDEDTNRSKLKSLIDELKGGATSYLLTDDTLSSINLIWKNGSLDINLVEAKAIEEDEPIVLGILNDNRIIPYIEMLRMTDKWYQENPDKLVKQLLDKLNNMIPFKYGKVFKVKLKNCFEISSNPSLSRSQRFKLLLEKGSYLHASQSEFKLEEILPH